MPDTAGQAHQVVTMIFQETSLHVLVAIVDSSILLSRYLWYRGTDLSISSNASDHPTKNPLS